MVMRLLTIRLCLIVLCRVGIAGGHRALDEEAAALISRLRSKHGLSAVRPDPQLNAMAAAQARAMASAGVMAHDVAGDFASRIERAGLGRVRAVENIGAGFPSLSEAVETWRKSPAHRDNLLMSGITRMGLARVGAPNTGTGPYWALVLAGPEPTTKVGDIARARRLGLPEGIGLFVAP